MTNHFGSIDLIPPKLQTAYTPHSLIYQASYYDVISVSSRLNGEKYLIRTLNTNCKFFMENPSLASTLFVKEILHLLNRYRRNEEEEFQIVEDFEIFQDKMAFVMRPYSSLGNKKKVEDDIETMIKSVISDLDTITNQMQLLAPAIFQENICCYEKMELYFLSDYGSGYNSTFSKSSNDAEFKRKDTGLYALGMIALDLLQGPVIQQSKASSLEKSTLNFAEVYTRLETIKLKRLKKILLKLLNPSGFSNEMRSFSLKSKEIFFISRI